MTYKNHQFARCYTIVLPAEIQVSLFCEYPTLPETNSSPLKMAGWNTTFLLGFGLFSGAKCWFQGG